MTRRRTDRLILAFCAGTCLQGGWTPAEPLDAPADDEPALFADLALEDLLQIKVTSVSGLETSIASSPAAVFVITRDDLRRGGYRTIPDALRMVPGLHVANIFSNTWAVGARGMNDRFTAELLVLVDGRAVYNDLYSGIFWDEVDLLLEDVDRIEVIRGPGATIWGANAVNGVINIVSQSAAKTPGLYLFGGGGVQETAFGGFRYGLQLAEHTHARFWAKFNEHDHSTFSNGAGAPDDWRQVRAGVRLDVGDPEEVQFTLDAGLYDGTSGTSVLNRQMSPPYQFLSRQDESINGGHLRLRLADESSSDSGWSLQGYYDHARRIAPAFSGTRDTLDIEFRHHFRPNERHEILWGIGYRHRHDSTRGSFTISYDPDSRSTDKFSAFIQDTYTIVEDRLTMLAGAKLEYNDYSGFEVQPTARLTWTPSDRHTIWGAVSRAVRTPSRADQDIRVVAGVLTPPHVPTETPLFIAGGEDLHAEELIAYELGYRTRPHDRITVDIATFYHDYDRLLSIVEDPNNPLNRAFTNDGTGEAYGIEVAATWQVADNWDLHAGYALTRFHAHEGADDQDSFPQQSLNLRSHLDLTDDLEFNSAVYFVDEIPTHDIDAFVRVDLGLTWRPNANTEISLWVQNLLDDRHPEFRDSIVAGRSVELERAIFGQVSFRF